MISRSSQTWSFPQSMLTSKGSSLSLVLKTACLVVVGQFALLGQQKLSWPDDKELIQAREAVWIRYEERAKASKAWWQKADLADLVQRELCPPAKEIGSRLAGWLVAADLYAEAGDLSDLECVLWDVASAYAVSTEQLLPRFMPRLEAAARARRDKLLDHALQARRQRLQVNSRVEQSRKQAIDKLADQPEDPAANQILGLLDLQGGIEDPALNLLARAGDARLKAAATASLADIKDAADKLALSRDWLALAKRKDLPRLDGLQQMGIAFALAAFRDGNAATRTAAQEMLRGIMWHEVTGAPLNGPAFAGAVEPVLAAGGTLIATKHINGLAAVAMSSNGQLVATGPFAVDMPYEGVEFPDQVKVWSAASGALVATAKMQVGNVHGLRFSPNGRYLAVSGHGLFLLDINANAEAAFLDLLNGCEVVFHPRTRQMAFSSRAHGGLVLCTLVPEQTQAKVAEEDTLSVDFSRDGRLLLRSGPASIELFDFPSMKKVWRAVMDPDTRTHAKFLGASQYIVAVSHIAKANRSGFTMTVWDTRLGTKVSTIPIEAIGWVNRIEVLPNPRYVSIQASDGGGIWDLLELKRLGPLRSSTANGFESWCCAFDALGNASVEVAADGLSVVTKVKK